MKLVAQIWILALLSAGLSATNPPKQVRKPSAQKAAATATPVQQEAPTTPEPPPTPEQMPASPPQVTMSNGMLTISAENSTMGDVLNGVKNATGANIDIPSSVSAERVVAKLGPGQPREVLQKLLAGSKFDYIIVGSDQDTNAVQKVILTPRGPSQGGNNPVANAAVSQPSRPMPPPQNSYAPPPDYSNDNAVEDETVQPEPEPPSPEVTPPNGPDQNAPQPQGQQPQQQGPKTPEELLKELQQMQQQQQQRPDRNPQPR